MDEKVQSLWLKLTKHYQLISPPSHIQGLTAEMIRQSGKGPKLRAKGAETRGVVPFALECAIEMNEHCQTTKSLTILQCLSSLMDFYMLMQLDTWHRHVAAAACRKFCILYSALSQQAEKEGHPLHWRVKPKFHTFCELAEYQTPLLGNPAKYWSYADQDFVGWVAKLAASKGGPKAAATTAKGVLERYRAMREL